MPKPLEREPELALQAHLIREAHSRIVLQPGIGAIRLARQANEALHEEEQFDAWRIEGLDYPSFRISLLAKAMDRMTMRELAATSQMPVAEWRVLSRLALFCEGLTVRQIAVRAWADRAEVSRAARALEIKGLVSRRDNPKDGRAPILFATEQGMEVFRPIMALRSEFHSQLMEGFTPQEIRTLDALLEKLAENIPRMMDRTVARRREGGE